MTSSNGNILRVTGLLGGEPPVTGGYPSQRPVTMSFDVFFDLRLNKGLWANNRDTGDLRHHCAHPDVTSSSLQISRLGWVYWSNILRSLIIDINETLLRPTCYISSSYLQVRTQHSCDVTCQIWTLPNTFANANMSPVETRTNGLLIIYPFPNFNGATVKIWECINIPTPELLLLTRIKPSRVWDEITDTYRWSLGMDS